MPAEAHIPAPYPLAWPPHRARTPAHNREGKRYEVAGLVEAIGTVDREVERWRKRGAGGERIVNYEITTNHIGRGAAPADPGAALWFTIAGGPITGPAELRVLACDKFRDLPQNVRALSLTMERLRHVAEVGAYTLIAAVEGAKMLPPPERPIDWRAVLGLGETATLIAANATYRALALEAGEGSDRLKELNAAIAAARKELGA